MCNEIGKDREQYVTLYNKDGTKVNIGNNIGWNKAIRIAKSESSPLGRAINRILTFFNHYPIYRTRGGGSDQYLPINGHS